MIEFCIGVAMILALVGLKKGKYSVKGSAGLALFVSAAYGIGYILKDLIPLWIHTWRFS